MTKICIQPHPFSRPEAKGEGLIFQTFVVRIFFLFRILYLGIKSIHKYSHRKTKSTVMELSNQFSFAQFLYQLENLLRYCSLNPFPFFKSGGRKNFNHLGG